MNYIVIPSSTSFIEKMRFEQQKHKDGLNVLKIYEQLPCIFNCYVTNPLLSLNFILSSMKVFIGGIV